MGQEDLLSEKGKDRGTHTHIVMCFVATDFLFFFFFPPVSCLAGSLPGSEERRDFQIIKVLQPYVLLVTPFRALPVQMYKKNSKGK